MKSRSPALSPAALASVASRKTAKVQQKLRVAEVELHEANAILVEAVPTHNAQEIDEAVQRNIAAEEKVHEATQELEEVKELLCDAHLAGTNKRATKKGLSGHGSKSLIGLLGNRPSKPS